MEHLAGGSSQLQYSTVVNNKEGTHTSIPSSTGKCKVSNIDVYLEPLMEDLLELWRGVQVIDISRPIGDQQFNVKGILMWTMHDYPGLGEISGKNLMYVIA